MTPRHEGAGIADPGAGVRALGTDDPLQGALTLAYGYLNRSDRTEAEVRSWLEQRGVIAAAVSDVLEELSDQGVLDDARYARLFVEDKRGLEQWGNERIRRTLQARGIDRELTEQALTTDSPESERDRALALLRRRFPVPGEDRRERERALGMLLRKGYDSELALDALDAHARGASGGTLR